MKKFYLSTIICLFISVFAYSQSITIKDLSGKIIKDSTIVISDTTELGAIDKHMLITNLTNAPISLHAKKTYIGVIRDTENTFCFGRNCYPPTTFVSTLALNLDANATSLETEFYVDYFPLNHIGRSTVQYTVYLANQPTDSATVTLTFAYKDPTGIESINRETNNMSLAYPNPVKSSTSIAYNIINHAKGQVILYDILGKVMKTIDLTRSFGIAYINVAELKNGVYFYAFVVNGKVLKTNRLIVSH